MRFDVWKGTEFVMFYVQNASNMIIGDRIVRDSSVTCGEILVSMWIAINYTGAVALMKPACANANFVIR